MPQDNIVEASCYLVVAAPTLGRRCGREQPYYQIGKARVRCTAGKPSLEKDEVAISLKLSLPVSLFIKPQLTAEISVPMEQAPFVILPAVQENIAQAIREQTGFTVRIEAAAAEEQP